MKMRKILALFTAICVCLVSVVSVSATTVDPQTAVESANASYGYFTSFNYDVKANIINITAQLADTSKASDVMVKITEDNTNNVIVLKQFKSNNAGYVSASFVLNTELYDVNGVNDATLRVAADKTNIVKVSGIKLFSASELAALESFNSTVRDEASLESFLNTTRDILGIAGFDTVNVPRDVYNIEMLWGFIEDDYSGGNAPATLAGVINMVADILAKLDRTNTILDAINVETQRADNEINGNEIKRLLTNPTNADILFDQSGARAINLTELYARLARDAQGQPVVYNTIDEIEAAFTVACAAQELADREKGGQVLENGKNFIANAWSLQTVANVVMLSGAIESDGKTKEKLTIYMTDKDSTRIVLAQQTKTNQDGTFSLTLPLNAVKFNDLIAAGATEPIYLDLFISAEGYDKWQFYIPVFNGADILDMMNAFKDNATSITGVSQMQTFFTDYRKIHGIGQGYTADMYDILYDIYSEKAANGEYAAISNGAEVASAVVELNNIMNGVKNFVDDFNASSAQQHFGSMMSDITTRHAGLAEDFGQFDTLLTKVNSAVAEFQIPAPEKLQSLFLSMSPTQYTNVKTISAAFDAAYTFVTTPVPGGGGVGGGTGGGTGGGSGGGSGSGGGNNSDNEITIGTGLVEKLEGDKEAEIIEEKLPVAPFTDITSSYSWAKEAIDGLRKESIFHGDGDGKFRPGASMTREEYLKTLFGVYGIEAKSGSNTFSDVKSGEWYTDVITTACEMGIVNGIGNGKFGIGQKVSRADMVVMAARAAEKLGINVVQIEQAKIFEDYDEIPDYAYNYVVTFQQADFINGDDMKRFNPKNAVTRAEAAVLFWSIFNYIR